MTRGFSGAGVANGTRGGAVVVVVGGTVVVGAVGGTVVVGRTVVVVGVGTGTAFVEDGRWVAVADVLPQAHNATAGSKSRATAISHPRRVGTGQW
ncbi:MAG: hypothetical protein WB765_16870 [Acidimicrobiales bacterium]